MHITFSLSYILYTILTTSIITRNHKLDLDRNNCSDYLVTSSTFFFMPMYVNNCTLHSLLVIHVTYEIIYHTLVVTDGQSETQP